MPISIIQSAQEHGKSNKGFWDVPGKPSGMSSNQVHNIQVWEHDGAPDRQYNFINIYGDYYDIAVGHAVKTHHVKMEETITKNGANIQIERRTGDGSEDIYNRQMFTFKYTDGGRWKIYSDDGRAICLDERSSDNGRNVHLWEDHERPWMEWFFIDAKTKKGIYPTFKPNLNHISSKVQLNTIDNIDRAYKTLYKVERTVFKNMPKVQQPKDIIDKSDNIAYEFDRLNTQVYALGTALKPINLIPYVNVVTKPISKGLDIVGDKLDVTNEQITKLDESVINDAKERITKSNQAIYDYERELAHALGVLEKMKKFYVKAALAAKNSRYNHVVDEFFAASEELNENLLKIMSLVKGVDGDLNMISEMTKELNKIEGTVSKVDNGLSKMGKAFDKTDNAANGISDFMNKKWGKGNFSISLQQVLDGDALPAAFKKPIDNWKEKMMNKIKDKFNIEIPSVPGADEFNEKIAEIGDKTKTVTDNNKKLFTRLSKLRNTVTQLRTPFYRSIACLSYENMKKYGLTELTKN